MYPGDSNHCVCPAFIFHMHGNVLGLVLILRGSHTYMSQTFPM